MLHHHDIACHQIGCGKARELIVGKVPGLDTEEHTKRRAFNLCFARTRFEVLWCEEFLGVLGVVVNDVRAEHHFVPGLVDELAHLERHQTSELVDVRAHDGGRFRDHGRALCKSRVPPTLEAGLGSFKRRLKLLVGESLECLQDFAVIGVNALVGHGLRPLPIVVVRSRMMSAQLSLTAPGVRSAQPSSRKISITTTILLTDTVANDAADYRATHYADRVAACQDSAAHSADADADHGTPCLAEQQDYCRCIYC